MINSRAVEHFCVILNTGNFTEITSHSSVLVNNSATKLLNLELHLINKRIKIIYVFVQSQERSYNNGGIIAHEQRT